MDSTGKMQLCSHERCRKLNEACFRSLKWYKDDVEFYSYIPRMKDGSKQRFFQLPGVYLDVRTIDYELIAEKQKVNRVKRKTKAQQIK